MTEPAVVPIRGLTFRHKPTQVEGFLFSHQPSGETNGETIAAWVNQHEGQFAQWTPFAEAWEAPDGKSGAGEYPEHIKLNTPSGQLDVWVGQVVIRGVEGEFYPSDLSTFQANYDLVQESIPDGILGNFDAGTTETPVPTPEA